MASMSGNDECPSKHFGDNLHLTKLILDSGAIFHMTTQVSDFIPGSLEYTDKYIEVMGVHHITAMQKRQFQIIICDDNGDTFTASYHDVLSTEDLWAGLFSSIMLINLGHICLFQKGFCTV